jgi:hypothetical protein
MSFDQFFRGEVVGVVAARKTVKRRLERPSREQADCYYETAAKQNPAALNPTRAMLFTACLRWQSGHESKTNAATVTRP